MIDGEEQARALIAQLDKRSEVLEAHFEHTRIRWRRIGSGPPLVLVHGGNGSWLHWVRNIEALAARHNVWLPDLPGCGESGELAAPASLERLVAALRQNIDSLIGAGREIGLAAFSFGAVLASNLAAARGGVNRLALMGPTGHGLPRGQLPLKNWRLLEPGPAQAEAHLHNLSQLMLHERSAVDALALVIHGDASEQARLRSKKLSHTDAMRQALDRLQIPVLMAWGEHDPTAHAASTAQILAEGHPNRRCLLVADAGHWVQYERPGDINPMLCDWFG